MITLQTIKGVKALLLSNRINYGGHELDALSKIVAELTAEEKRLEGELRIVPKEVLGG